MKREPGNFGVVCNTCWEAGARGDEERKKAADLSGGDGGANLASYAEVRAVIAAHRKRFPGCRDFACTELFTVTAGRSK